MTVTCNATEVSVTLVKKMETYNRKDSTYFNGKKIEVGRQTYCHAPVRPIVKVSTHGAGRCTLLVLTIRTELNGSTNDTDLQFFVVVENFK